MRSILKFGIVIFVSLVMGGLVGWWLHGRQLSKVSDAWYEVNPIPLKGKHSGLGYSSEALFNSDIPLPEVTVATAKMKFLPAQDGRAYILGYVVVIEIAKLYSAKVPEKYKSQKPITSKTGKWMMDPLKEVVYELHLSFELQDKDGFQLLEVTGPKHNVSSGQQSTLQEAIQQSVSLDVASRTKRIVPKLSIDRCVSCD